MVIKPFSQSDNVTAADVKSRLLDKSAPAKTVSPETVIKAQKLDTLAAILPAGRSEQLAGLLTNDDVETLRYLAKEGMGENSLRALTSDLGYLEAWCQMANGTPLPWPAPVPMILKFVAHHLWDPEQRKKDASHGMPQSVAGQLEQAGVLRAPRLGCPRHPHAPATVRRRLSSWSTLTKWRGETGAFNDPQLRSALRLAVRATDRPRQRKSYKAVTADILDQVLVALPETGLANLRDRALLMMAFASGGRRRSEMASLRVSQLIKRDPVPADPEDATSKGTLPCLEIRLGRTKTNDSDQASSALLIGRPVLALNAWMQAADITSGAVFRGVDQWGNLKTHPLTPQAVNLILKKRLSAVGLDPNLYSAHGIRAGYLTEAAKLGIPLPEAMQQSGHRSLQQAANYYNDAERENGRAARLIM